MAIGQDTDGQEPILKDCPELLTLPLAAKQLGVRPEWLRKRAEDYGAIQIGNKLMFFKDIIDRTAPQIVGLLSAILAEKRQEYEQTQSRAWEALEIARKEQEAAAAQLKIEGVLKALNRPCQALTAKGNPCSHPAFQDTAFCWTHRKAAESKWDHGKCEALTKGGKLCSLPIQPDKKNPKRCWLHQHVPWVFSDPRPLPQTPKPKRSTWTPEMRAAAGERAWKGNRDYQERLRQELRAKGQRQEIKLCLP